MKSNKIFIIFATMVFFLSVKSFAKTNLFIFGAMNFVNSSGSASDYKEGENDFPIKNAHRAGGFGLGLSFPLGKNFFFGLEGIYNLGGKATLKDPSDNDSVEIDTYKNSSLFLTMSIDVFKSMNFNLFLNGGIGSNFILENETKIYTSSLGYETQILLPRSKINLTEFGGLGILYKVNSSIGVLFNSRYFYISYEDNPENGIEVLLGLNISF
ncbi:MAG: hypothetical protein ACUVUG_04380 [Candidatus Aminicenantia bacterium]